MFKAVLYVGIDAQKAASQITVVNTAAKILSRANTLSMSAAFQNALTGYVLVYGRAWFSENPLLWSICCEQLILQTQIEMADIERPAAVFYPSATSDNHSSGFGG